MKRVPGRHKEAFNAENAEIAEQKLLLVTGHGLNIVLIFRGFTRP
jgi:hypothetical protein